VIGAEAYSQKEKKTTVRTDKMDEYDEYSALDRPTCVINFNGKQSE
jgi:hypothetical protein